MGVNPTARLVGTGQADTLDVGSHLDVKGHQMSDKLDKWIVIAGSVALAAVLSIGLLASSASYSNGWNHEDQYPMNARMTLWFGQHRH